jgi:hypothetical protein
VGRGFDSSRQRQLLNDIRAREVSQRVPAGSGRYPSGQRGQTVNLLAYAFGGSNPPLPTTSNVTTLETGGNSSAVERQPSKLGVAGSNPVSRSIVASGACSDRAESGPVGGTRGCVLRAHVAQSAERVLGKDEVSGSNPDMGSSIRTAVIASVNGR